MKIRSITIGENFPFFKKANNIRKDLETKYRKFSNACNDLTDQFQKHNLTVETKRICTQPVLSTKNKSWNINQKLNENISIFEQQIELLENVCGNTNFDYFSCCLMLADENMDIELLNEFITEKIPTVLTKSNNFFTSIQVASTQRGINLTALKYCSKIIKRISEEPFNNLKFCVSSNVKPDTPFFPSAYHSSDHPKFSIALEMADEVVQVFENSLTLFDAQKNLKARFLEIYDLIVKISQDIGKKYGIEFHGIDFSPAPYPTKEQSIGTAVEKLNHENFGALGSLIAVAMIKNCIPKREKVIGFSGFMQPVFEDYTIAKRLSENKISIENLLLYSTICGTGLDCVPLPGDITERELFYLLLDLCIISITHDKPLTARLMPIPGKSAGEDIKFDFEYFAPSKVMDIKRLSTTKTNDLFYRDEKSFNLI